MDSLFEGEQGTVARAGATAGLPGWVLLFSSCEEGNAVILLPALLNSADQKYLGKKLVCTQHIDSYVTAGVRVFILYQVL